MAGEGLVELGVGFGGVNEEGADIGLFDGGEGADGGELLDADFTLPWAAETGGVENFNGALVVVEVDAVDVASSSLAAGDDGLLMTSVMVVTT